MRFIIFKFHFKVLHLGNVYFHRKQLKHGQEGVEIGSDAEIRWTGHLLRLDVDGIKEALTTKTTVRIFKMVCCYLTTKISVYCPRVWNSSDFDYFFPSAGSAQRTRIDRVEHRPSAGRQGCVCQGSVQFSLHVARGPHQPHRVQRNQKDDGHIDSGHIRFRRL